MQRLTLQYFARSLLFVVFFIFCVVCGRVSIVVLASSILKRVGVPLGAAQLLQLLLRTLELGKQLLSRQRSARGVLAVGR